MASFSRLQLAAALLGMDRALCLILTTDLLRVQNMITIRTIRMHPNGRHMRAQSLLTYVIPMAIYTPRSRTRARAMIT